MKSMTAYGQGCCEGKAGRMVVEIQSVNRKGLDISFFAPKELLRLELDVRRWIALQIERGQVTVRVYFQPHGIGRLREMLKSKKDQWEKLAQDLGYDPKTAVSFPFLLDQIEDVENLPSLTADPDLVALLQEAVTQALKAVMQMKCQEGAVLAADILNRLQVIADEIKAIEARKEEPIKKYQKKMQEKLQELFAAEEWQERLLKEVAVMAEKWDTTEELVRLHSHLTQFIKHLEGTEGSVGKTLDFLIQEMGREINTLSVKSQDAEMIASAIKIKSELEKIREQVQNVE